LVKLQIQKPLKLIQLVKKQLRNLAFEGSFSKIWTLISLNILGKTVSIKYQIILESGKLKNFLTVSCGSVSFSFGNTNGTSSNKSQSKISTGDKVLFTVPFPGTPIPVKFCFKIGGSIGILLNTIIQQKNLLFL